MNPFTGGCHYSDGCNHYQTNCKNCPQLNGVKDLSIASKNLNYKYIALENFENLEIVILCNWLLDCINKSLLFKKFNKHLIPNGIDSSIFKIQSKIQSKKEFGLSITKKGFAFLSQKM